MQKFSILLLFGVLAFYAGKYVYQMPKHKAGETAPDFSSNLSDGSTMKLSDLRGNYVLLDFWGSWCGPCRQENQELVQLNRKFAGKKFKDAKAFEIVSVGIETDKEKWLKAIEKDGLYWKYQVSDIKRFKSEAAEIFGVKSIPTKYLLDPAGQIISVNESPEEIAVFLASKMVEN